MLTAENIKELRKLQPKPLSELITRLYKLSNSPPRSLNGNNSILQRTFGDNFRGPNDYRHTFFDYYKGIETQTEFDEFCEALRVYDEDSSRENLAELLLEFGDILYQKESIKRHKDEEQYQSARDTMAKGIRYARRELSSRGIKSSLGKTAAIIKYGARVWCKERDLPVKNKDVERKLFLEAMRPS